MYDCFKKGAFVSLPLFNRHTLLPYHDHDLYGRFVPLGLFLNRYIVNILGTRGLPAAHGGFETFAQHLSLDLMARGWAVHIYCQNNREDSAFDGDGSQDEWMGVKRTHFSSRFSGPLGTIDFDLKCVRHVLTQSGVDLVLGYNTAAFSLLQKLKRRRVIMNMDGIEWKRSKWGIGAKSWFFINELIGANISDVPVADHPEIARHIAKRSLRKVVMIPYGSASAFWAHG